MKNKFIKALVLGLGIGLTPLVALSHGSLEPQHGGIVKEKHEMVVELVRETSSTSIYVKDHDDPMDTSKLRGSLTILAAGKKQEIPLLPAGGNKMAADVVLAENAKVLVKISPDDHHPVVLRYSF